MQPDDFFAAVEDRQTNDSPFLRSRAGLPRKENETVKHTCSICGRDFDTLQGAKVHIARMHKEGVGVAPSNQADVATPEELSQETVSPSTTDTEAVRDDSPLDERVLHHGTMQPDGTVTVTYPEPEETVDLLERLKHYDPTDEPTLADLVRAAHEMGATVDVRLVPKHSTAYRNGYRLGAWLRDRFTAPGAFMAGLKEGVK